MRNRVLAVGCDAVAAIGFGIVSYGHFFRGGMELGWTFAILSAAQLGLAVMNGHQLMLAARPDRTESR